MKSRTKFEAGLKEKLDSFEPKGVESHWNSLKKELPKQIRPLWQKIVFFASSACIISAIVIFTNSELNNKNVNTNESTTSNVEYVQMTENSKKYNSESNNVSEKIEESNILESNEIDNIDNHITEAHDNKKLDKDNIITDNKESNNTDKTISTTPEITIITTDSTYTQDDISLPEEEEYTIIIETDTNKGCIPLEIKFNTNANSEKYDLTWHFKDGKKSNEISPIHTYEKAGEYKPVLILTPKSDDVKAHRITGTTINCFGIQNIKIDFVKSGNLYTFNTINRGDLSYTWSVDNQKFTSQCLPFEFKHDGNYEVNILLTDQYGCKGESSESLDVTIEHNYFMSNAFTPSDFGVNSSFGPVSTDMENLKFTMLIFEQDNQRVYETNDVNKPWNGFNVKTNQMAEAGVYIWKIVTEDQYGNIRSRNGQVTLIK
jgi:hypothetical protein